MANVLLMQTFFLFVGIVFWGVGAFFIQPDLLKQILASSLLGGLAALLPAIIFAYLLRYLGGSVIGLIANELVKILLTIMLFVLFVGLDTRPINWLPLLTSYLLVLKSYGLVLLKNRISDS